MSGVRQISGVHFVLKGGIWSGIYNNMELKIISELGIKCSVYDKNDFSETQFETVHAAKSFAKRKRHGRSLEEHKRAEFVQDARELNGWSLKETAEKLGVSPRTIEAWSSGSRAVPKIVIIALKGGVK